MYLYRNNIAVWLWQNVVSPQNPEAISKIFFPVSFSAVVSALQEK
jgi:hypothetical protein